ncbi:hypothetical protein [Halorientalis sp.]|uniref:hypothetical protein n=1 Tax=Halorientalis sp. TaxID=1931229 RepID=UPI00262B4CF2|nr:hypothetical protein [Halorientalis sp.]
MNGFDTILQTAGGQQPLGGVLQGIINLILFPVQLILAVVLPLLGLYVIGPRVGKRITAVGRRVAFGEALMETPLGAFFRDEGEVDDAITKLISYFLFIVALVFSFGILGSNRIINYIAAGANYYPSFFGGVLMLLVGFVIAGYVARNIKQSETVGSTKLTPVLSLTAKMVIYFVSITLALDAFGYSTTILNTLAQAVAIGLGLGIALAVGISVGLGGQDYVASRIDDWLAE